MSNDKQLEFLKRRRFLEMHRRLMSKRDLKNEEVEDPRVILRKAFVGRGWEVWEAAQQQYPIVTQKITPLIISLMKDGKLRGKITGEQLYWFFSRLGLRIRLNTKIRVLERGELKTIADKLRET